MARCPECPVNEIRQEGLRDRTTIFMGTLSKWYSAEQIVGFTVEEMTAILREEVSITERYSLLYTNVLAIAARAFRQGLSEACSSDGLNTPSVIKI
ncbi:MAG TPA: hypothetical protein VLF90_04035 [Patescibacteria group bacterium]|nr:hypothetical protein [Patescibacteria group bacterium]